MVCVCVCVCEDYRGLVSWDRLLACAPSACVQHIHVKPAKHDVHPRGAERISVECLGAMEEGKLNKTLQDR